MVRWGSPKTPPQKPILMQIGRPVFGTSRSKRFPQILRGVGVNWDKLRASDKPASLFFTLN